MKLLVLLLSVSQLFAADFILQTVDGLNRPVSGVHVEVNCYSSRTKSIQFHFESDSTGTVHGTYDNRLCKPGGVSVEKKGYVPYFAVFRPKYVMERQFTDQEVEQIAQLTGEDQLRQMRELLAGNGAQFADTVFRHDDRLTPSLRILVREPEVAVPVRDVLSTIAGPEDMQLVMRTPPPLGSGPFAERWRYRVATALVNPDTEDKWAFLRSCAFNEFNDRWVDAGAIQTLKLTASQRSEQILIEAAAKNPYRAVLIDRALKYIGSNPAPMRDPSLEALGKRLAQVLDIGNWEGNKTPVFNEPGDKALMDLTFQSGEDYLVYTATFHRIDNVWVLRGVHEFLQALRPAGRFVRKK